MTAPIGKTLLAEEYLFAIKKEPMIISLEKKKEGKKMSAAD